MSWSIRPPDLSFSYSVSADWLEVLCLVRKAGTSSDADVTGPNEILDDRVAVVELDSTDDVEDSDIIDPPQERALDALFEEIARRKRELGSSYPFTATFSTQHLHLKCAAAADDPVIQSGRDIYRACLIMSALRNGIIDAKSADIQVDPDVGNLFRICATLAAAGYVRGDAYWFGAPRPDKTTIFDALNKLTGLLKVGLARSERPAGESKYAKDAGVDVVAWRAHSDDRPSKLIVYCQCASGMNWEGKPVDGKVRRLDGYYSQPPSRHWLPALMLPFPLYMGKENAHELKTEEAMNGFYSQIEAEMGLIFDRSRIVNCAIEALRDLLPEAKTAADKLPTVVEWCNETTLAIGAPI